MIDLGGNLNDQNHTEAEEVWWRRVHDRFRVMFDADCDFWEDTSSPELDGPWELEGFQFPRWLRVQNPARCIQAVHELRLMLNDGFVHQLGPLHEYILWHTMRGWDGSEAAQEEDSWELVGVDPTGVDLTEHSFWDVMGDLAFWDQDFLMAEEVAQAELRGVPVCAQLGINMEQYLEFLPQDIQERLRARA